MAGTFFIGAGRKEDRAINATDNTPGSTRAGMIGQRPVYSDLVYQLYVRSLFTDIARSKVSKDRNYGDNAVVTFQLSQPCAACHT